MYHLLYPGTMTVRTTYQVDSQNILSAKVNVYRGVFFVVVLTSPQSTVIAKHASPGAAVH